MGIKTDCTPFAKVLGKSDKGFLDGDWILSEDMSEEGEIGIVQLKHIGKGEFLKKNFKFITREKFTELGCTHLKEGDLLVSRMAEPICRSCILPKLDFETVTAVDVAIVRPDPSVANVKYLNYLLNTKSIQNQAKKYSAGTTRERISKKNLEKLLIPLPSIATQKNIVSVLDKISNLKKWRNQSDKLTQDYLYNIFVKMFGESQRNPNNFEIVKLKVAFSKSRAGLKCGPFGSALKKHEYTDSGIPVWTMDNIVNGKFSEKDCLYINKEKHKELRSYSVENGDIIISRAGTVGKMGVVETFSPMSIISSNLIRLSLDKNVLRPIFFVCLMEYFKGRMGRLKTGPDGSYTFMNTNVLENLEIPLPTISVQMEFEKKYLQIQNITKIQYETKLQINNLSNYLTTKAFSEERVC